MSTGPRRPTFRALYTQCPSRGDLADLILFTQRTVFIQIISRALKPMSGASSKSTARWKPVLLNVLGGPRPAGADS